MPPRAAVHARERAAPTHAQVGHKSTDFEIEANISRLSAVNKEQQQLLKKMTGRSYALDGNRRESVKPDRRRSSVAIPSKRRGSAMNTSSLKASSLGGSFAKTAGTAAAAPAASPAHPPRLPQRCGRREV